MATTDIRTGDLSGFLTRDQSAPIFEEARQQSVFQQLFQQTQLGINGQSIPVVTGRPTANWVTEGGEKPVTDMGLNVKTMDPKKLAAITVMSAEVVRANPGGINEMIRPYLAEAFARAFDYAVAFGLGGDGTGTGPFAEALTDSSRDAVAIGDSTQGEGGVHGDFVAAMQELVGNGKKLTGFALDDELEPTLWGAVDSSGRPLYTDLPTDAVGQAIARPGRLLNRPSYMGPGVSNGETVGFAGDFTRGAWGVVGGISYRISTETAIDTGEGLVSMFQRNMVAVLAEAEYGFVLADKDAFVELQAGSSS